MAGSNPTSQVSQSLPFDRGVFLKEVVLSLIAALLTGLAGGLLLILLVFGWGNAQAETAERPDTQLPLRGAAVTRIWRNPVATDGGIHA